MLRLAAEMNPMPHAPIPAASGTSLLRRIVFAAACAAAVALLVAAYANHFDNGFHFDDSHVIVDNLYLRSLKNLPRFFSDPHTFSTRPESALYRPLLTLSYALDYRAAGGLEPRAFHRTQFALLLLLGALLVAFYRRVADAVGRRPSHRYLALSAAALFCLHTANTQTVNYLCSRSDLLATLAIVASLLAYARWPRLRRSLLYLVPLVIGGFAKPLTVVFPALLLAYRLLIEDRLSPADLRDAAGRRRALAAVTATLPAFVVALVQFAFTAAMDADTVRYSDLGRWSYLLTQPFVWLHYARLFVLPIGLTADTDWTPITDWYDTRVAAGILFALLLAVAAWRWSHVARLRPAAFGIVWFFVALVPSSTLFPLQEVYNEHRIFFPYVGLTLAAAWLFADALHGLALRGRRWRRVAAVTAVAVVGGALVAHAVGTRTRNRVWLDELTLWEDVAEKSPANGRGLMNYGVALMARGYVRQALTQFERAEVHAPDYEILQINLAISKSALGEPGAESHFRRAFELSPGYARGRYFYGLWLAEQSRGPEAIAELERAVALSAGDLDARDLLCRLLAAAGDDRRLAEIARGTLAIVPADPSAAAYAAGSDRSAPGFESAADLMLHGWRNLTSGRWLDASGMFRRATLLEPRSAEAWLGLGRSRIGLGFVAQAESCFARALEIDPTLEDARRGLEQTRGARSGASSG